MQYREKFYNHDKGNVKGGNHSVFQTNIAMQYAIWDVAKAIPQSQLYKRFIDDIILIS